MIPKSIPPFAAFAVGAILLTTPARAADPQEEQVTAVSQAACEAFRTHDLKTVERLLAPDFTLVSSNSEIQPRAQAIAEIKAGDPQYEVFRNHDTTARVYGDAAIVQGITSLKGTSGGKPFALDVRFTDTLIRLDGEWKLVVSHVTRIPAKP